MNEIAGCVAFNDRNKYAVLPIQPLTSFNLDLCGGEWDVGIDQSTSCTGICLERTDKSINVLLDVKRDQSMEVRMFYRDLFKLLNTITESGDKFRFVVMEKPAPKDMYASRVLQELKGRMEEWIDLIPGFEGCLVDSLYQQTWKSYVVDKSKGKNRGKSKECVADDLADKIPLLRGYLTSYPFSSYDSFDACGILYGFKKYAFNDDGQEQIHGVIEKKHVSLVGYQWVDADNIGNCCSTLGDFVKNWTPKVLAFNERYNLHTNIRMASSNNDFVVTIVPRNFLEPFMWKYGINIDDTTKRLVMYVLRKGRMRNSDIAWFCGDVPWNEEVYND